MAHHFLNGVEIRPVFQKVHRKLCRRIWGVMSFFNMGRFPDSASEFSRNPDGSYAPPLHIYKQGRFSGAATMPGRTSRM